MVPAADFDLWLEVVPGSDRSRRRKITTFPCLSGCQALQGAMRTVLVEPAPKLVDPTLDAS